MREKVFSLLELFESANGDFDIQQKHINGKGRFVVSSGATNTGIIGKTDMPAKVFGANTITVDMFGYAYFRSYRYKMVTHARVFSLKMKDGRKLSREEGLYLVAQLQFFKNIYSYSNMASWKKVKNEKITLPIIASGEIDFSFMGARIRELEAARIRELEAYLKVTGLSHYSISTEEEQLLAKYREGGIRVKKFAIGDMFNNIKQGSRLTNSDQVVGNLPFVMSGATNTGISAYISNKVEIFPKNSITVDIFGNTFYRDYEYGMGDDTGALWDDSRKYNRLHMLYFAGAIKKALSGLFDYGHKLRSSRVKPYEIELPVTADSKPDLDFMERFIKIQQKLAIKNVIDWRDRQIATTKQITQQSI